MDRHGAPGEVGGSRAVPSVRTGCGADCVWGAVTGKLDGGMT